MTLFTNFLLFTLFFGILDFKTTPFKEETPLNQLDCVLNVLRLMKTLEKSENFEFLEIQNKIEKSSKSCGIS